VAPEVTAWPTKSKWWVILTTNGEQPTKPNQADWGKQRLTNNTSLSQGSGEAADMRWNKVNSLAELENIYDLGMFDNTREIFWNRG